MSTALAKMQLARSRLLSEQPWYGTLSLHLNLIEDQRVTTMQTNGSDLRFNPEWVSTLTDRNRIGWIAHEALHCALLHPYRVGARDLKLANIAGDYAANALLHKAGFDLPGWLYEARFDGPTMEQIYAVLDGERPQQQQQPQQQPQQQEQEDQGEDQGDQDQDGDSDGDGDGQPGQFVRAPKPQAAGPGEQPPAGMSEVDWHIADEQAAMVGRKAGTMPGDTERAFKNARQPVQDWRTMLLRFVQQNVPSRTSFCNPDRRFVYQGLYLPGRVRENTPKLGIGVDTSGSISQDMLDAFGAEITSILHDVRPESIEVVYCDYSVSGVETFTPDDTEVKFNPRGGGGTRLQPVFDHFADTATEPPAAVIYFTDLDSADRPQDPGYPVLWLVPEQCYLYQPEPFGELVRFSLYV